MLLKYLVLNFRVKLKERKESYYGRKVNKVEKVSNLLSKCLEIECSS